MTLNSVPSIDLLRKALGKLRHGTTGRGVGRDHPLDTLDWVAVESGLALLELVIESEDAILAVSVLAARRPVLEDFGGAAG
jgi:cobalamin biosynthesis protein CbiG